jgi:hypothetical protein
VTKKTEQKKDRERSNRAYFFPLNYLDTLRPVPTPLLLHLFFILLEKEVRSGVFFLFCFWTEARQGKYKGEKITPVGGKIARERERREERGRQRAVFQH